MPHIDACIVVCSDEVYLWMCEWLTVHVAVYVKPVGESREFILTSVYSDLLDIAVVSSVCRKCLFILLRNKFRNVFLASCCNFCVKMYKPRT